MARLLLLMMATACFALAAAPAAAQQPGPSITISGGYGYLREFPIEGGESHSYARGWLATATSGIGSSQFSFVAEGGGHRQCKDGPEQAGQRPADDDREDDRSGMELDGGALDLRHQEVVLELLDERVHRQRRDDGADPGGRR